MTLYERLKFRLLMLWAAVQLGPTPSVIRLAVRTPRIAGGAPEGEGGDEGGKDGDAAASGEGGDGDAGDEGDDDELDLDRAKAKIAKVNQEAASLRKRLKEAEPLAQKALEAEEAAKDEKTKLTEAKEAAAQEAAEAKTEAIRLRMLLKYGLEEDDLDLLGTGDEEAIEARAKRLQERSKGQEPNNGRVPRERLRPGAVPSSEPEETDPRKLAAGLPRH